VSPETRSFSLVQALAVAFLAGTAIVGHVLYPLWLAVVSRGRQSPRPPAPPEWPGVSVVVPAYLEKGVIAAKVANLEENGYPGELEVIVVASDPETAAATRTTRAHVLSSPTRLSKPEALNRGVEAAGHPIVVLTDANAMLRPGAIASLVPWFSLPDVDAVTGEKLIQGDEEERTYWRFESWLKLREWRKGTTIGVDGALVAVRRAAYRPMPTYVTMDDIWLALDVVEHGGRIAYEPAAHVDEEPTPIEADWERRTRVVACTLEVLWRRKSLLLPGASEATPMLWGHRLIRSSLGPVAHGLLLLSAIATARRSRLAKVFLAAHLGGLAAVSRVRSGADTTFLERVAAHVLYLQAVGIAGTARYVRGDRSAMWRKMPR
jgi:cellulose synthase/poly-beta-1,6-N-acetylglucosamine synthase-like glycosyltransferase